MSQPHFEEKKTHYNLDLCVEVFKPAGTGKVKDRKAFCTCL